MTTSDNSPWDSAGTVAGFVESPPNDVLMRFAAAEFRGRAVARALDIGCGAGRNAVPLARLGWQVTGIDLSRPMLAAAAARSRDELPHNALRLAVGDMDKLPVLDATADLLIAHGIWNLAMSAAQFRAAVREAARAAKPGAALFVFTFSRNTLADNARPVADEPFVFTEFSGRPQCFLTAEQLVEELGAAGFVPDPAVPLTEYNRPAPRRRRAGGPPALYEAAFRKKGPAHDRTLQAARIIDEAPVAKPAGEERPPSRIRSRPRAFHLPDGRRLRSRGARSIGAARRARLRIQSQP